MNRPILLVQTIQSLMIRERMASNISVRSVRKPPSSIKVDGQISVTETDADPVTQRGSSGCGTSPTSETLGEALLLGDRRKRKFSCPLLNSCKSKQKRLPVD